MSAPRADALFLVYYCRNDTIRHFPPKDMNNEVKNVVIEIVDLETGEILLTSRKQRMLYSYGLQGLDTFFNEFHSLLRTGVNCTINVSAFDVRYNLSDAEDVFITFKHIPDVY